MLISRDRLAASRPFTGLDATILVVAGFCIWPLVGAIAHGEVIRGAIGIVGYLVAASRLAMTLLSLPADPRTAVRAYDLGREVQELQETLDRTLGERDEVRVELARVRSRAGDTENALREYLKILNLPVDERGIRWVHGSMGRNLLTWHNETLQEALDRVKTLSVDALLAAMEPGGKLTEAARRRAEAVHSLILERLGHEGVGA